MYIYSEETVQRELWLEICVALVVGSVYTWLMRRVAAFDSC